MASAGLPTSAKRPGFRVSTSTAVVRIATMKGTQHRRGIQAYVWMDSDPHKANPCGHAHRQYRGALACGVRYGKWLLRST